MPNNRPWLGADPTVTHAWHERWYHQREREARERGYLDEQGYPRQGQCGGCRYFIPLTGSLIEDWGACANASSAFDGRVMFEHLGCDHFAQALDGWGGPHRSYDHLHRHHYSDATAVQAAQERQGCPPGHGDPQE